MKNNIIKKIEKISCGEVIIDSSLKKYNTYKVDSNVLALVLPHNIDELKNIIKFCKDENIDYKIIGNGSNLIYCKKYYEKIFINLCNLNKFSIDYNIVIAESGVSLQKLALKVSKIGLSGLEFATGIPATIGGAIYMNAGAYNSDMSFVVEKVKLLNENAEIIELQNKELNFSYRHSLLQEKQDLICIEATFKLNYDDPEKINKIINDRKERRKITQPLEYPSAGSVFRNPSREIFAGKLIEDLNLKGKNIGDAKISEKHANFIINDGNANGEDIKNLILYTKKEVKNKYNIDLKIEQEFVE